MSANATLTVHEIGVSPGATVTVSTSLGGGYNGQALAGIYNLTVDGVPTPSFCIDVFRTGANSSDYSYVALPDAPVPPPGPMGLTAALNVEKLWAAYYPAATGNATTAAALQGAIWTVVAQGGGYTTTISGTAAINTAYANMLASLPTLTATANLRGLVDEVVPNNYQGYVVPVPEPTTLIAGALLLLPFGASTLRILRRKAK